MEQIFSENENIPFVFERNYRVNSAFCDVDAKEPEKKLWNHSFFAIYEAFRRQMPHIIIPKDKAAFERLVVLLDRLARQRHGVIRAKVDTELFQATIEVILPFFEFCMPDEKEILHAIDEGAHIVCFEPTDDGCVRLYIMIRYFEMLFPSEDQIDERMLDLLDELFGDDI